MRRKYEKQGADAFETHQLIEMLLFYSLRQRDTNPVSHELLKSFPGESLLKEEQKELCAAPGIGESSAALLKLSSDTTLRLLLDIVKEKPLESGFSRTLFLWLWFKNRPAGTVGALLLDKKNKFLDCVSLSCGRTAREEDYAERLTELCESTGAAKVILCHEHRDGAKEPSVDDVYLTAYLKRYLENTKTSLEAHYVLTDTDCFLCPVTD